MRYLAVIFFIGVVTLIPSQHVFAHEVTEFYGVGGCPVNSCGITDWDSLKTVSDGMFYVSLATYSMITFFCLAFFAQKKPLAIKTVKKFENMVNAKHQKHFSMTD